MGKILVFLAIIILAGFILKKLRRGKKWTEEKEYKKIENEQETWAELDILIVLSTIGNGAIFVAKKINEKQKNT